MGYLDPYQGDHASFQPDGEVLGLEDLVHLVGLNDQVFQLDLAWEETHVKLAVFEPEDELWEHCFQRSV